jgi:Bacterial PH domain
MNAQNNGHEHELEPVFGLPEPLPRGEIILWQGAPDFGEMAVRVFHLRKAVFYFIALLLARAIQLWMSDAGMMGTLMGMLLPTSLALIALAAIVTLAWLTARTTAYTLTDQRVVMRVGIVLTLTFNLPLKTISTASLQITDKGFGDIPLALAGSARIAWLHLWPHTRPWRVAKPEPMLRCVPDAPALAALLSKAWVAATGNYEALAKPSLPNNVPSVPQPSQSPQAYPRPAAQAHQWEATLT